MENQAATRRERYEDGKGQAAKSKEGDDVGSGSDRISQLRESVLHHILCFLSQKNALRTSVLSKSWRHLGPTRPVIDLRGDFYKTCFDANKEKFVSVVDNTFQRYHDHNLFPRELRLRMLDFVDSRPISVLEKWIPIIFIKPNASLNAFHISFALPLPLPLPLPLAVFKVESLRELYLEGCTLEGIDSIENDVVLNNLQTLSLSRVCISGEALEKVLSGCPLVKRLVLKDCKGFETINIGNKKYCLNCLEISCSYGDYVTSIEINNPTLESIRIDEGGRSNWCPKNINYFPHLKSLLLSNVALSIDSFHYFSCNFPCLQELSLLHCSGFDEINLSSHSIKCLIINETRSWSVLQNIAIEQTLLYFELSSKLLPKTLSLATTSREWKSNLYFNSCMYDYENGVLRWILNLHGLVKAVSQSQISLTLFETLNFKINQIEWDFIDHPVEVEHLDLYISKLCPDSLAQFLNALFNIFRPRYTYSFHKYLKGDEEVTECLWKTLIQEREKIEYGWGHHLEEVNIETFDEKGKIWHHVPWACLPEWSKNQKIRFLLKWRD